MNDPSTLSPLAIEPSPRQVAGRAPLPSLIDWQRLVVLACSSSDRLEASVAVAGEIARALPQHTVRMGWGHGRAALDAPITLDRLFDSRLGWLGVDNSIRQRISSQWQSAGSTDAVLMESSGLALRLRPMSIEPSGNQDLVGTVGGHRRWEGRLWILPPMNDAAIVHELSETITELELGMLASALASRPAATRWRRWGQRIGRLWAYRALIACGITLLLLLALFPRPYPVKATALVRAMDSRIIAAPVAASLSVAHVRPGDRVTSGQTLVELDGRPLRIEREAVAAEWQQAVKDEDIALASGQIGQAQLAGLKKKSLAARLHLIDSRLQKLIVVSPIDGLVIQGDLQHMIGSPVELGQTLLEVAPEGRVEVELEIPESEIAMVIREADVRLWFPALGNEMLQAQVESLWPAATIRDDQNVFVGQASLDASGWMTGSDPIRVGMRGEATIRGPQRPFAWRWIRTPLRRLVWMLGW